MEMIVMSDSTALSAIRIAPNAGTSAAIGSVRAGPLLARPITAKTITGIPIVPMTPSGSRRKILISSQVSLKSPRICSVSNGVAGETQEDVFQRRRHRAEIGDLDASLGQALNDARDEFV